MFSSSAPGRPITTRLAKRPLRTSSSRVMRLIAGEGGALQRRQQLLEGALRFQRPCLHPVVGQPREERHGLHGDVGLVLVVLREMHGIDGAVEQRGDPRGQAKRHDGIRAALGNRKNGFVQASPPTTTPQTTVTARCVKGPRLPGQRREMIACCIFPWDVFLGSTSWVVATPGGSGSPVVGVVCSPNSWGRSRRRAARRGCSWRWPAASALPCRGVSPRRTRPGRVPATNGRPAATGAPATTDQHRDLHQQRRADGRQHFGQRHRSTTMEFTAAAPAYSFTVTERRLLHRSTARSPTARRPCRTFGQSRLDADRRRQRGCRHRLARQRARRAAAPSSSARPTPPPT